MRRMGKDGEGRRERSPGNALRGEAAIRPSGLKTDGSSVVDDETRPDDGRWRRGAWLLSDFLLRDS